MKKGKTLSARRIMRLIVGLLALCFVITLLLPYYCGVFLPYPYLAGGWKNPDRAKEQKLMTALNELKGNRQKDALAAFHKATSAENWRSDTNWLSDEPVHKWQGVKADFQGRVVGLTLRGNNLSGEIPSELARLDQLRHLNLSRTS